MSVAGWAKTVVRKGLRRLFGAEAAISAAWARGAFRRLRWSQWSIGGSPPYFDHRINLYYHWPTDGDPGWLERGMMSRLALNGGDVLELTCGNGFNTRHFYASKARRVIACDFDRQAIDSARRVHAGANIEYVVADLRESMPEGRFGNVIWDFGFPISRFFTDEQADRIVANVRARLESDGIFSGYTAVEPGRTRLSTQMRYDFTSADDLRQLLSISFANVRVLQINSPGRCNLYFWASDGALPLQA